MSELRRVHRPCAGCPWRVDAEPGRFTAARYEQLRATVRDAQGREPAFGTPLFACHATPEGGERACAGWLAVEGRDHLSVRLALAMGDVPYEALQPGPGWPTLYPSYDAMVAAQGYPEQEASP